MTSPFTPSYTIPLPKFIFPIQHSAANCYIDFDEGGSQFSAVLDVGWRLPEDLAIEVARAMNATVRIGGTYTCTFNRSTDMFTITKATGGGTLNLLWLSGSHSANCAASSLGFSVAADSNGALAYTSGAVIPNRFVADEPVRSPAVTFTGNVRDAIAESGVRGAISARCDAELKFTMDFISEDKVNSDWMPFMGRPGGIAGPWCRGMAFDFYPNSLNADFIRLHPKKPAWNPKPKIDVGLDAFYKWEMDCREIMPAAGTITLADIYIRTPP